MHLTASETVIKFYVGTFRTAFLPGCCYLLQGCKLATKKIYIFFALAYFRNCIRISCFKVPRLPPPTIIDPNSICSTSMHTKTLCANLNVDDI